MADADKTTTLNHFYEKLLKIKVRPAVEPWHFTSLCSRAWVMGRVPCGALPICFARLVLGAAVPSLCTNNSIQHPQPQQLFCLLWQCLGSWLSNLPAVMPAVMPFPHNAPGPHEDPGRRQHRTAAPCLYGDLLAAVPGGVGGLCLNEERRWMMLPGVPAAPDDTGLAHTVACLT